MRQEFHPHVLGPLSECIRIEIAKRDTQEIQNGKVFHELEAEFWNAIKTGRPVDQVLTSFPTEPERRKLNWSHNEFVILRELKIEAVEEELPILDSLGEQICLAHLDARFSDAFGLPYIVDWKTGRPRNYDLQIMAYGLAVMQKLEIDSCRAAVAFVETGECQEYEIRYEDAIELICDLYDEFQAQKLPHTINQYCEWCSWNGKCPAWLKQADKAIVAADRLSSYLPIEVDKLKNDPVRLEEFLLLFDRLKQMVEDNWDLKNALLAHTDLGYHLEKYTKVSIEPKIEEKLSCNPEEFLKKVLKTIGTAQAAVAITVDVPKAKEIWQGFTGEKEFPIKVRAERIEKKGYSYLRRKIK